MLMKNSGSFFKLSIVALLAGFAMTQAGRADTIINLNGVINGAQDKVSTPWTGTVAATLDTTTDLFSWNVNYNPSPANATLYGTPDMAHFHFGAPGVDGPIVIVLGDTSTTSPLVPIPTSFVGSQTVTATQADQIAAGDWYVNVHTNVYPAGIIRGQLTPTPEPASLLLLGGGLGALLVARRRRKQA